MSLTVHPAPVVKSSIIVLSWPCKASWVVLNALKTNSLGGTSGKVSLKNSEISVVYHCLAKALEFKLKIAVVNSAF